MSRGGGQIQEPPTQRFALGGASMGPTPGSMTEAEESRTRRPAPTSTEPAVNVTEVEHRGAAAGKPGAADGGHREGEVEDEGGEEDVFSTPRASSRGRQRQRTPEVQDERRRAVEREQRKLAAT